MSWNEFWRRFCIVEISWHFANIAFDTWQYYSCTIAILGLSVTQYRIRRLEPHNTLAAIFYIPAIARKIANKLEVDARNMTIRLYYAKNRIDYPKKATLFTRKVKRNCATKILCLCVCTSMRFTVILFIILRRITQHNNNWYLKIVGLLSSEGIYFTYCVF